MQKYSIDLALQELVEIYNINSNTLENFINTIYSSTNLDDSFKALDSFINENFQGDMLKIKQKFLDEVGKAFQRYFIDVADFINNANKHSHNDKEWHEQKLRDAIMPYMLCFKRFLSGLDFDEAKKILCNCLQETINTHGLGHLSFYINLFSEMRNADNFDELLFHTENIVCNYKNNISFHSNYTDLIGIATTFLLSTKFFILKSALYEHDIVDTDLQGGSNLSYFVHFTDKSNLDSILKNGILSRKELEKRGIEYNLNDTNRFENALDYISISITNPNNIVQKTFVNKGSIKEPILIYLDPFSILSFYGILDVIFCDKNAAAAACNKGDRLLDFRAIFAPNVDYGTRYNVYHYDRIKNNRKDNEPTDPQAEILVQTNIAPNAISHILDANGNYIYRK